MGIPWVISKTRSIHNPFKFPDSWEAAWAFNSSNGFVGGRNFPGIQSGENWGEARDDVCMGNADKSATSENPRTERA